MSRREIDVHLEGETGPIGRLVQDDYGALAFTYAPGAGRALSLALPLRDAPYGDAPARAFFRNLLQENAALEDVAARLGVALDDVAGLLHHLGRDCPGAISCVPAGAPPGKRPGDLAADYEALRPDVLAGIMARLRERRRLPREIADPSPVAGVQGKLAVAILPDGRPALPLPGSWAPTTHILKVPREGEGALVDHEHALMRLAAATGLVAVPPTAILEHEGERGLLVERFDRVREGNLVRRIHQEDFCQALGLPPQLKYERDAPPGLPGFSASAVGRLLSGTAVPATDRGLFRAMTWLNLLLGNTDNHAKNHALLHAGTRPRLAPLYDVTPVLADASVRHDLAFRIGAAERAAEITEADIHRFEQDIGFPGPAGRTFARRSREAAREVAERVVANLGLLEGPRLKLLADMVVHQAAILDRALGLGMALPQRDAFLIAGGGFGWAS